MLKVTTYFKPYILIKIDQIYLKGQYGSTVLSCDRDLSKIFQGERKKIFTKPYRESLRTQDGSNGIVCWYEFTEYFVKYKTRGTISAFDKDWSSISKRTIRVNSKDSMVQVV